MSEQIPETKQCTKCGRRFPATPEWFWRDKNAKSGLAACCIECDRRRLRERSIKRAVTQYGEDGLVRCQLCGELFGMQMPNYHLPEQHNLSFAAYKALGYDPISPAQRRTNERTESTKHCTICKRELPATPEWFHLNNKNKSGLAAKCIECVRHKSRGQSVEKATILYGEDGLISCQLCGEMFGMQIPKYHLHEIHNMSFEEYKALGYEIISSAKLQRLMNGNVAQGRVRRLYGEEHWNYKGGHVNGDGYRIIFDPSTKRRLLEHRFVMEKILDRPLASDEVVHHKDGNRQNNDPENLQLMTKREHDNVTKHSVRIKRHIQPETVEAAKLLVSLGWNNASVARALRISMSTLARWLEENAD